MLADGDHLPDRRRRRRPSSGTRSSCPSRTRSRISYGDGDEYTNDSAHLGAIFSHTSGQPGTYAVDAVAGRPERGDGRLARLHLHLGAIGQIAAPGTLVGVSRVVVDVVLKPEISDPQGQAVLGALGRLGHDSIRSVRQGKHFVLEVDGTPDEAELKQIAETLLANPVIEDVELHLSTD